MVNDAITHNGTVLNFDAKMASLNLNLVTNVALILSNKN